MAEYIDLAIKDKHRRSISFDKIYNEKMAALNFFADWYMEYLKIDKIEDLLGFERMSWLKYIDYINDIKDISNKTKNSKAKVIKDFINWAKIKQPQILPDKNIIHDKDLDIIKNHYSSKNLAFSRRKDAEVILRYIVNQFDPSDLKEQYYKELIIIAANSGARIGELKLLEYGSVFYSEDEGLYKTIIRYTDKLKQENRPIYFTKDGYEAIKRVERLRSKSGELVKRYDKRAGFEFIRLFEYNEGNGFLKTSLYSFIARIKRELGLVDEDGNLVPGNMHAFRHFFAMTVFVESNYNISVVRYLLGHRSYNMSFKYLEEEKYKTINMIRMNESQSKIKISGKGLDTFINMIIGDSNELLEVKSMIDSNSTLYEILKNKNIRKVSFGYCLNPCEEKKECIMCNNFLLTNEDKNELINSANDLFEFLCYKISLFNNLSNALEDINIQKNLNELLILVGELKNLEINMEKLSEDLKGMITWME